VASTDEPRIPPLPPDEWPEELRPLAAFTASGEALSVGDLNIFRTLAQHPALFQSWAPFGAYLLTNGTLPFEERELLILRTGFNCGSPYEWGQHVRISLNGGIDRETIDRVVDGPDADGWSGTEAALLRAADELHSGARITDETWAELANAYDERQLIEIAMTVGQYHMVAFALNSLGVEQDEGIEGLP
jgi:4-carboxymuconolactone decarboxylase